MGMGIIVILVCAFGFLVYHKFDLRQRQLLAANVKGQGAEETDLLKAVADQADEFSGFAAQPIQPVQATAKTELLEPEFTPLQPAVDTTMAARSFESSQQPAAANPEADRSFGAGGELFAGMDEPSPEQVNSFERTSAPSIAPSVTNDDPFAMLGDNSEPAEPLPFQPGIEPNVEPNLFATANPEHNSGTPEPTNEFPAFDEASSVAVPVDSTISVDVADSSPFTRSDSPPVERFPSDAFAADALSSNDAAPPVFGGSPLDDQQLFPEEVATTEPVAVPTLDDMRELPLSGSPASPALARSISQSNQFDDNAASAALPDFPADSSPFGSSPSLRTLPPVQMDEPAPRFADASDLASDISTSVNRQQRSRFDDFAGAGPADAGSKDDLHNVIAMLDPSPDVNLFEDPASRRTTAPKTFPRDNESKLPAVEEPTMPQFPGFDQSAQQRVPDPVIERFPVADEASDSQQTFDSPNLFQEPIVQQPKQVPAVNSQARVPVLPIEEFDPVPLPTNPAAFDPIAAETRSLRPYEPEPPAVQPLTVQPLTLGPEDGIARMIVPGPVQQTSGTYKHKEICEVRDKDNYWTISKRIYGTPVYFSSLALYNEHRIPDPRKLRPGMKVLVPDPKILEAKYPEFFQTAKATASTKPSGYFLNAEGKPAYRVGQNETLGAISQKHLGRASRWIQIYQMNRQTLKDPNRLKPGTVINLPDDATNVRMSL